MQDAGSRVRQNPDKKRKFAEASRMTSQMGCRPWLAPPESLEGVQKLPRAADASFRSGRVQMGKLL
jgi:hypothetical protein